MQLIFVFCFKTGENYFRWITNSNLPINVIDGEFFKFSQAILKFWPFFYNFKLFVKYNNIWAIVWPKSPDAEKHIIFIARIVIISYWINQFLNGFRHVICSDETQLICYKSGFRYDASTLMTWDLPIRVPRIKLTRYSWFSTNIC